MTSSQTSKPKKEQHIQERQALRATRARSLEIITTLQQELLLEIPNILAPIFKNIDNEIASISKKYTPAEKVHSRKRLMKENTYITEHATLLLKKQQLLQTYNLKYELKKLNATYLEHLELLKKKLGAPIPPTVNQSLLPFESVRRTLPSLMSIPLLDDLSRHLEQLQTYKATLESGIHYLQDHLTNEPASSSYSESDSLPEVPIEAAPVNQVTYGFHYLLFLMGYLKDYILHCLRNCFTPTQKAPPATQQAPTEITLTAQQKQFTPYLEARFKRWVAEARVRAKQTQLAEKERPVT